MRNSLNKNALKIIQRFRVKIVWGTESPHAGELSFIYNFDESYLFGMWKLGAPNNFHSKPLDNF